MDAAAVDALVHRRGPAVVVQALTPYLSPNRRERIEAVLRGRIESVHVAIEAPSDPHNAAAVVRTCEALGVLNVHVIGAEGRALHKKKTTQGAFVWIDTHHHRDLAGMVAATPGIRRCAAVGDARRSLAELDVTGQICLMFGNENRGLSPEARAACTDRFRIPMVGMSESLNLSVSAAIAVFDVLRRRATDGDPMSTGDLDPDATARLRARYYARSVDPRLLHGLWSEEDRSA